MTIAELKDHFGRRRFMYLENRWINLSRTKQCRLEHRVENFVKNKLRQYTDTILKSLSDAVPSGSQINIGFYIAGTAEMLGYKQKNQPNAPDYYVPRGVALAGGTTSPEIALHCHLCFAPFEVIEEIFLHEVAHLIAFMKPDVNDAPNMPCPYYTERALLEENKVHNLLDEWGVDKGCANEAWMMALNHGTEWEAHFNRYLRAFRERLKGTSAADLEKVALPLWLESYGIDPEKVSLVSIGPEGN